VFDPDTIAHAFDPLSLDEFSLIDDRGDRIISHASFKEARQCRYGCGLFAFSRKI